jgi:hypothetical protein
MAHLTFVDVIFKTPDAVDAAVERMMLQEDDQVEVKRECSKWVEYGELNYDC